MKSFLPTAFALLLTVAISACEKTSPEPQTGKVGEKMMEAAKKTLPGSTETAKTEPPKVEAPKVEAPKVEAPKAEPPKVEPPKPAANSGDAAIDAMRAHIAAAKIDKSGPSWKTTLKLPPKLTFDPKHKYFWQLQTSEGPIKVRFMPDVAPQHVSSTIFLTELGFYDGLSFHRVIRGFMAQGGDPLGNGMGGPGYEYAGEFSPVVKHDRPGLLSMANKGGATDGSQFFLTFVPTPHLDGRHTIFGEVVEGMDTVKKLESFGSQQGPTQKPLSIVSAKITFE